jgi:hypothetical protein
MGENMNKDYINACNQGWLQRLWMPKVGDRTDRGIVSDVCLNKKKEKFIYTATPDLKWYKTDKVIWFPSVSRWLEMLEWRKFYRVLWNLNSKERIKNNYQNISIECIEMSCFKAAETAFGKEE